jgi:hypothetical protein
MTADWKVLWDEYINSIKIDGSLKYCDVAKNTDNHVFPLETPNVIALESSNSSPRVEEDPNLGHFTGSHDYSWEPGSKSDRELGYLQNASRGALVHRKNAQTVFDDFIVRYETPSITDNEQMCQIRATDDIPYIPNEAFIEVKGVHGQTVIKSYHCVFPNCSKSTII